MMSDKMKPNGLKLLNDSAFNPGADKDAFNHEIYAKILSRIFHPESGNEPGISVALFGKWGQGKSSVVEMLRNKMSHASTRVIVFNAWTARGDSVRRQLVLKILNDINPKKAKEFKKHTGANLPNQFNEKSWKETAATYFTVFWQTIKSPFLGAALIGSAALVFIVFFAFKFAFSTEEFQDVWIAIASLLAAASAFLFLKACNVIENVHNKCLDTSPLEEHQLLKYPEQFAEIASRYMAIFCKAKKEDLLIVVDDLDRCDPATVVEALASIKQLSAIREYGRSRYPINVKFLIPCDEKQVVLALEADGHDAGKNGGRYHDYQSEELLRKFFDVVVRMDALIPEDMVSYSEKLLQDFEGVTDEDIELIQELVGAVTPKDPRQVKKLINAFLISKEKTTAAQESKFLQGNNHLDHFDKTRLTVIALQETVPSIFSTLVETPLEEFERLRTLKPESSSEADKKAANIIRALEPISYRTFSLLTKKGLPETLINLNNGSEIYEAMQSGDETAFASELERASDLSCIVAWLKEHRKSLKTVAQFRNRLSCLMEPAPLPPEIIDVISYYINGFPQVKQSFRGFENLIPLALIASQLDGCKQKIYCTLVSNLKSLPQPEILESPELKALLIVTWDLTDNQKSSLAEALHPLFKTEDIEEATNNLKALKLALPEDFSETISSFAFTIARDCIWDIYPEDDADSLSELHSTVIAAFAGSDEGTLDQLIDLLFSDSGPLHTPVDLSSQIQIGAREAMLTLKRLSPRLTSNAVQKLFGELHLWLPEQMLLANFHVVCDALGSQLFNLSEEQIDNMAIILTDRACTDEEPAWLFELTDQSEHSTDETKANYNRFCKKVFERIAEQHLASTSVPAIAQSLLTGISENSWSVADEAEAVLAEAIESKITNEATWNMWKTALWPLCRNNSSVVKQATAGRIKENIIPEVFIPFAVEELFNKKLTNLMEITLKEFFYTIPNALSCEHFASLFDDETVEGRDQVIRMIIEDLGIHQSQLDEPRMAFLIEHSSITPPKVISRLGEHIRIKYLQAGDISTFFMGITHINNLGAPSNSIKEVIRNVALEQASAIPAESRILIETILGEQIFNEEES